MSTAPCPCRGNDAAPYTASYTACCGRYHAGPLHLLAPTADHASVEFVARSKLGGRAERLHEISRFVREDGRWFYVDGDLR